MKSELDETEREILAILLMQPGCGFNELYNKLKSGLPTIGPQSHKVARFTLTKKLNNLREKGAISEKPNPTHRQKKNFYVSPYFLSEATKVTAGKTAGYVAEKWISKLHDTEGYEIRFLNSLTGIQSHKNFVFAWHPQKKDIRILQFFSPREYLPHSLKAAKFTEDITKPVGQRIEKFNSIEEFLRNQLNGKSFSETEIKNALKKFFDYPKTHNCFYSLLMPSEEIHFGMPMVGNFESILFLGLGYEHLPLIPEMLEFQPVMLERPVSESVIQKFYVKIDIGKLNKWLQNSLREEARPELGMIVFYNTLVCKHNDGQHNVGGRCQLGIRLKCNFERTPKHYEPPCEHVLEELGLPFYSYSFMYKT